MNPLLRLLRFALPHKLRILAALPAMVLYALASGGLAYLIEPIFDELLPAGNRVALICGALIGLYLVKGAGAYFSVYLMADAGQRLVHDLRTELFRHMLGQSAAFFAPLIQLLMPAKSSLLHAVVMPYSSARENFPPMNRNSRRGSYSSTFTGWNWRPAISRS